MKTEWAVAALAVLLAARTAYTMMTVLVTDDAAVRALSASGDIAAIDGTVESVSVKQFAGGVHDVYLHFVGVENDRVFAVVMPLEFEDTYGVNLAKLVGKTVEITSRVQREANGQMVFSAMDFMI